MTQAPGSRNQGARGWLRTRRTQLIRYHTRRPCPSSRSTICLVLCRPVRQQHFPSRRDFSFFALARASLCAPAAPPESKGPFNGVAGAAARGAARSWPPDRRQVAAGVDVAASRRRPGRAPPVCDMSWSRARDREHGQTPITILASPSIVMASWM